MLLVQKKIRDILKEDDSWSQIIHSSPAFEVRKESFGLTVATIGSKTWTTFRLSRDADDVTDSVVDDVTASPSSSCDAQRFLRRCCIKCSTLKVSTKFRIVWASSLGTLTGIRKPDFVTKIST